MKHKKTKIVLIYDSGLLISGSSDGGHSERLHFWDGQITGEVFAKLPSQMQDYKSFSLLRRVSDPGTCKVMLSHTFQQQLSV